MGVSLLKL